MLRFLSLLIFTLCVVNFIFQGNAVITSPKSENSDNESNNQIIPDEEKRTDLSVEKKAALTMIREYSTIYISDKYVFPNISKKIQGKWTLSTINAQESTEIHLCPDINVKYNKNVLDAIHKNEPSTQSCLFTKQFKPDEPKICIKEPIPWLSIATNLPPNEDAPLKINCRSRYHQLITFQYNNCNPVEEFLSHGRELFDPANQNKEFIYLIGEKYPTYEICYDFYAFKTLWTRHRIQEPMLIYDSNIPQENKDRVDLNTVGTSTYYSATVPPNTYTKLMNIYQLNKNVNINAEYMVPMQHLAMQNWKKTTDHLINTAPLQEKFHQLMKIINQGIAKASYYTFTQTGVHLQIFTSAETKFNYWIQKLQDNTWYKFIYNESNETGALIYLHNVSGKPPASPTNQKNLRCDFNKWIDSESDIPEDILAYAGCCEVSSQRVKEIYEIDARISEPLDIQSLVSIADITDTTLHFMKKRGTGVAGSSQQSIQNIEGNEV